MAHQSFAKTVCDTLKEAARTGGGEVAVAELSCLLWLQTRKEHKRLLNTLSDLTRGGKVIRVRQGVYAEATTTAPPAKREVMWRLLKMRRRVTVDDLVELAGVSLDYAREWLAILVKREVVRKIQEPGGMWVLINDSAEMPVDDDKAAVLRLLRVQKKAELAGRIDTIENELKAVKKTIAEL